MDCEMPEMDGYVATRAIRQSSGPNRSTTIIALTANATSSAREECLAAGMDDYLSKPLKRDTLEEMLERYLGAPA
jgi:CheY-like chemotaxis protein